MNMRMMLDKEFWKYIIPAMCISTLSVFYEIVDGFFIGQGMGDDGLAAIHIAWPIAAFITAAATGIGIGGSVLMSTCKGEEDEEGARKARGNTVFLLIVLTLFSTTVFTLFTEEILIVLGAEGKLLTMGIEYIKVISLGAVFQIFSTGINPLLRNIGKPKSAMIFMIAGLISNIVFDALFILVFQWGLAGAALATVMGQGVAAILAVITLYRNKENVSKISDIKPESSIMKQILQIALSPFGLTFAPSLIIVITNWQAARLGGGLVVASYSIISYLTQPMQAMLQGAGDGVQPLISYYNGNERTKKIKYLQKKTLKFVGILAAVMSILFMLFRNAIPKFFGASPEVAKITATGIIIASVSFVFTAIARFTISYFYAINHSRVSSILAYLDPLILSPLFLLILPNFFGVNGLWMALPVSQFVVAIISIILLRKNRNEMLGEEDLQTSGSKA